MLGSKYETVSQSWGKSELLSARAEADSLEREQFQQNLADYLGGGASQVALFSSARVGLQSLLRSLHTEKIKTVMLSALNCPVVADAVTTSGMKPVYYDLATKNGDIDCRKIAAQIPDDCGIVIIPHLYGLPAVSKRDLAPLQEKNIIVIEDCAHSFGAAIEGSMVGTLGDYAIFSFNHDKPISLGGGGMVWSNKHLPPEVITESERFVINARKEWRELRWFRRFLAVRRICGVLPARVRMRLQKLYKICNKLFKVEDGGSGFPASGVGCIRARLGSRIVKRYESIKEARNQNAIDLIQQLKLPVWGRARDAVSPAWIRLRVLMPSQKEADGCVAVFREHGLRVGRFNWPDLPEEIEESKFPNASMWAKCGVDLPIHAAISTEDLDTLASSLNKVLR